MSAEVHWAIRCGGRDGKLTTEAGCMSLTGTLSRIPELVTCKRCKALPSYRCARRDERREKRSTGVPRLRPPRIAPEGGE
ncbi:MAG: hypothetical protein OXI46_03350 [Gemmatimonadota bacterium]|nr:hypothetical protein [Gemmatimonadota bacterium]